VIRVEHTGDGTLVHGTDKDDLEIRAALREARFKFSRNLDAWFLPRPWSYAVRSQRVRQFVTVVEALGREVDVEERRARERSSAEIETDRVARAEARAERMADRSTASSAAAAASFAEAQAVQEMIPPGQPILVGHHSERRHRKDLEKIDRKLDAGVEASRAAETYERRADSAAYEARKNENPALIKRRLERLEADRRRIDRRIDGSYDPWAKPAEPAERERLGQEAADLDEQIAFQRGLLASAETERGRLWRREDFRIGDEVLYHGTWYPVKRVNPKSLSIPPLLDQGKDLGRSWTEKLPYDRVRGRRRDGVETAKPTD
jgi:hypothetical protein